MVGESNIDGEEYVLNVSGETSERSFLLPGHATVRFSASTFFRYEADKIYSQLLFSM